MCDVDAGLPSPTTTTSADQQASPLDMGMALEQLFVRVSDAPEASPGETCAQQVARACGLAAAGSGDEGHCTLSGFADTKQQLAVACMLHWQLMAAQNGATVSVSDSVMGTSFSLAELLNCDKELLAEPQPGAVRALDAAAFVEEVVENEENLQILDCRTERDFLGLSSGKEVSGHLSGAKNVPFAAIFAASTEAAEENAEEQPVADKSSEGAFLLSVEELREVFELAGVDAEKPVAVVGSVPSEAAAVATALVLAGHHAAIAFCIDALTDALVNSFPASYTADIFDQDRLMYADDAGGFDLSPSAGDVVDSENTDGNTAEEIEKAYNDELSGKAAKERGEVKVDADEKKVEEVVWIKDNHRFFDMPSPVSKEEFLEASREIFRVVSFVLAPFGFPASLRKKRSLQEVKTSCGALFQDVIEVCSDLIYQEKGLNEGTMAMSVHKWVEEKHDHDCTDQVKAINELWSVLYSPPAVVEVPDISEERVTELATKLAEKLHELVGQRTPWAYDTFEEEEDDTDESNHSDQEKHSWDEEEDDDDADDQEMRSSNEDDDHSWVDEEEEEAGDIDVSAGSASRDEDSTGVEENTVEFDDKEQTTTVEDANATDVNVHDATEVSDDKAEESSENEAAASDNDATKIDADSTNTVDKDEPVSNEDERSTSVEGIPAPEGDNENVEASPAEDSPKIVDKLAESWKFMYPSVIYTLGFIPQDVEANHKKLSTLQLKSFIQAVAEASWGVMGSEGKELSQVEFQALCETLHGEKREQVSEFGLDAENSLYVLKHFLTRSRSTDDALADRLAGVREAVLDGDIRRRSGRTQVALANYSKAFDYLPLYHKDLENAVVGRARCFIEMNELERARTEALIALKLNPYSVGGYECLGSVEDKSKNPEEAMQHYVTAFILDGSRSPELAECIDRSSRLVGRKVAKALFADMEKVHELPSAWLVESYFDSFEHDADYPVSVPFDIAKKEDVEQSDLDSQTLLYRAIHHKRSKNYGDAQRDVWTLVARNLEEDGLTDEQRALAFNLHASLLYVVGDVHAAVETINKSLELHPTCVNSLVKKGGFLAEMGETDEATSCFSEAMELDPNDADVHLHLGQMELLDGNYYKAAQCLRRCISRSEELPVTHVTYGMALYKSGSTYQAKDVFEEASKKFPESAEVHLFHGEVLSDQGNYADAMRHFLTAWELSPQCPLPFLNAGRVYVGTNDPMRAIAHFKQALEVDPRCSSAHLDIAQVLFAQGRTKEAFEHFKVAASCCRFLPEVEEVCACQEMAKMQLKVTEILGVELRHIMRSK